MGARFDAPCCWLELTDCYGQDVMVCVGPGSAVRSNGSTTQIHGYGNTVVVTETIPEIRALLKGT